MANERKRLIEIVKELHDLFRRIQLYPLEAWDTQVEQNFRSELEKIERRLLKLKDDVEKLPDIVKYSTFKESQLNGIPFYWLEWRHDNRIERGRDYFVHPFVGIELISALELTFRMVERAYELLEEKTLKTFEERMNVQIDEFVFQLAKNWNYRLRVITPRDWRESWQVSRFGKSYSVKHRSIIFLQTFGLAPNYFAGYTWVNLSEEEIALRLQAGRRLQRWRTLRYDPNNLIRVRRIRTYKDRIVWMVDFSDLAEKLFIGARISDVDWVELLNRIRYRYKVFA